MVSDTELATRVREFVALHGLEGLVVDDLRPSDVDQLGWSGSAAHLRQVGRQLVLAKTGVAEYLVVRAPRDLYEARIRVMRRADRLVGE